mgnify:CR=1 FL=1
MGQFVGSAAGAMLFDPACAIVFLGAGAFSGVAQGGKISRWIKNAYAHNEATNYYKDLTHLVHTMIFVSQFIDFLFNPFQETAPFNPLVQTT